MKYNFDKQISRRGTDSYKWDSAESENVLPMWVADMDFRTAPAIVDALRRRVEHGIFGFITRKIKSKVSRAYFFYHLLFSNTCDNIY